MYTFVNEIDKLKYGSYIRWIDKNDVDQKLKRGMFICDIIIGDEGINIKGKTITQKFLVINMEKCHIFQKLSKQEQIIQKIKNIIV